MSVLRVLSHLGDSAISWDAEQAAVGDEESLAAVREAEQIFANERARGATAFKTVPGRPAERIDQFDPVADEIILVPRVSGG
ncbi:MAG: hypothetical protein U0232_32975 [Thermomicrobiales bacterium]